MTPSSSSFRPVLAPPGAGLPPLELFFARILFGVSRRMTSREAAAAAIVEQRGKIEALVGSCDRERAAQRVLIKRLPGLEDSSRDWSVWMTLDHLRIVNRAIAGTLRELLAGRVVERVASTADVKPSPEAGAAVLGEFQRSCDELLQLNADARSLRTRLRYAHPWFGPLDGAGWFFMAGFHLSLHRTQVERILAALEAPEVRSET